ncbi:hypothetical protein ACEK07_35370 [Alcanivoracaceae bacterium MT1]
MKRWIAKVIEGAGAIFLGAFLYAVIYPSIVPVNLAPLNVEALLWGAGVLALVIMVVQPWVRILKIAAWLSLCGLLAVVVA